MLSHYLHFLYIILLYNNRLTIVYNSLKQIVLCQVNHALLFNEVSFVLN